MTRRPGSNSPDPWQIDGRSISVSNLGKVYWPEDNLAKEDMLRYYMEVAPFLLPHLKDRPVTLRVFPEGIHRFSYYRRDLPDHSPTWLRRADYRPSTTGEVIQVPVVDDVAGLVWLANQGSIEFHMWASRLPELAQPDQVLFDLDPGDEASFADVLQAALRLRDALDHLGLRVYAKTSGGKGLHVHLPLAPGYSFEEVREWVKSIAEQLASDPTPAGRSSSLISVASGPTHRGPYVAIDYAQNSIGRNTAAPYTLRAHPKAPVSAPLTWKEIEEGQSGRGQSISTADFTLRTIGARLEQMGDLFAPVLQSDQRLPGGPWLINA